jgi:hypothetical protein
VTVVATGIRDVALVVLTVVHPNREDVLTGAAPVRHGEVDVAVVRAVLSAYNRPFELS